MSMIYDFLDEEAFNLPTMESLDILCNMMEECRDIHGIVTLAVEVSFFENVLLVHFYF